MDFNEILEIMTEMVDSAVAVPLSGGKCIVNGERMRELIADLQDCIPQEIAQAKRVLAEKDRLIEDARKEAESKVKIAEEHARRLVEEDEITKKVKERANDMMSLAMTQSKELKNAASDFADNLLRTTEQGLVDSINQLRAAKSALRNVPNPQQDQQ